MFIEIYNKLAKEKGSSALFLNENDELKTIVFQEKNSEAEVKTGIFLNKKKTDEDGEHVTIISCIEQHFDASLELYNVLNSLNAKFENITLYLENGKMCAASFYKGNSTEFLLKMLSVNLTTLALANKRVKEV